MIHFTYDGSRLYVSAWGRTGMRVVAPQREWVRLLADEGTGEGLTIGHSTFNKENASKPTSVRARHTEPQPLSEPSLPLALGALPPELLSVFEVGLHPGVM